MLVLVTGAAGQVAQTIFRELQGGEFTFRALDIAPVANVAESCAQQPHACSWALAAAGCVMP